MQVLRNFFVPLQAEKEKYCYGIIAMVKRFIYDD